MKKQILAYITALTNNHIRMIEAMIKYKYSQELIAKHTNFKNELSDLQDFVADLQPTEAKENDEIETLSYHVHIYKNKVVELTKENIQLKKDLKTATGITWE